MFPPRDMGQARKGEKVGVGTTISSPSRTYTFEINCSACSEPLVGRICSGGRPTYFAIRARRESVNGSGYQFRLFFCARNFLIEASTRGDGGMTASFESSLKTFALRFASRNFME